MKTIHLLTLAAAITAIPTLQAIPIPTPTPFKAIDVLANGIYSPTIKYAKGALVSYNGNTFLALAKLAAGVPTSNTNSWAPFITSSSFDTNSLTNPLIASAIAGALGLDDYNVAIGLYAGQTNQDLGAVAVGGYAGQANQASHAIALGWAAGLTNQGLNSIAIGYNAGYTAQAQNSVAIGVGASEISQGSNSVAIGGIAGYASQGSNSVAVGASAGKMMQGQNAVAIGASAGFNTQHSNSIVINATGNELNAAAAGTYVKPIRTTNSSAGLLPMYYNSATGEIFVIISP